MQPYFNNSLTVDILLYDENFVPLHCQDEDGDDAPTREKRFSHVHSENLPHVSANLH